MSKIKITIDLNVNEDEEIKEVEEDVKEQLDEMKYWLSIYGECKTNYEVEKPIQVNTITSIKKVGGKDGSNKEDSNKG